MSQPAHKLVLTRSEVRAIDEAAVRELRIPGLLLMENAAHAVTSVLVADASQQIVIVCGPGNNGGDGLAVARQLAATGRRPRVLLEASGRTLSDDARTNLGFLERSRVTVERIDSNADPAGLLDEFTANDWIVDCLLGTGVSAALREPFVHWVHAINASAARVLAVDVPTGMNCDDGSVGNVAVCADQTVTFVGVKSGFQTPTGRDLTGTVTVAPIGLPIPWIRSWLDRFRHSVTS